ADQAGSASTRASPVRMTMRPGLGGLDFFSRFFLAMVRVLEQLLRVRSVSEKRAGIGHIVQWPAKGCQARQTIGLRVSYQPSRPGSRAGNLLKARFRG